MKKMICEICESHSFKKENGVFVCLECGTEYSIEDAKKLLQEVGELVNNKPVESSVKSTETITEKDKMINALSAWVNYLYSFDGYRDWISIPGTETTNKLFWEDNNPSIIRKQIFQKKEHLTANDFNEDYPKIWKKDLESLRSPEYFYSLLPPKFAWYKSCGIGYLYGNDSIEIDYHSTLKKTITSEDGKYNISIKPTEYSIEHADILNQLINVPDETKFKVKVVVQETYYTGVFIEKKHTITKNLEVSYLNKWEQTINNMLKTRQQIKEQHHSMWVYVNQHFDEMKEAYAVLLEQKCLFIELFDLPFKYRDVKVVSSILELFTTGRADTWKEAVNIYETEKYQAKVLTSLATINSTLGLINQTIVSGFRYLGNKLDSVSNDLENIARTTSKMLDLTIENNYALEQIMKDTRYSLIRQII